MKYFTKGSYSHYWEKRAGSHPQIEEEARKQILEIATSIVFRYSEILAAGGTTREDKKPVVLTDASTEIRFNGLGKFGNETFCFNLLVLNGYSFCKTNHAHYDLPVCEMLIVLAHFLPGLRVWSDGFDDSGQEPPYTQTWKTAAENVREYYGVVTKLFIWDGNPKT